MFVHGAGYLQNVSKRYPVYFREQMFHNLLVEKGYIVLDMDYRASKGYGRDWRTAIYRQMGYPELDDYVDGVNWMVANHQGDAEERRHLRRQLRRLHDLHGADARAGDVQVGRRAAPGDRLDHLQPRVHVEHPEHAGPRSGGVQASRRRSNTPTSCKGNLLISHGMVDDNVFYQDSVRIAQRLIELKKDNWELASYPLERHAFVQPESWYDQYRRIYQLFERTLK